MNDWKEEFGKWVDVRFFQEANKSFRERMKSLAPHISIDAFQAGYELGYKKAQDEEMENNLREDGN